MKLIINSILAILFAAAVTHTSLAQDAEMPDRELPKELAVLEKFLGTWDHIITFTHANDKIPNSVQKTESKRSWSMGSSFLRIEEVNWAKPQYSEFQMLLTYDVLKKTYSGVRMEGETLSTVTATWDEATQSMAFKALYPDNKALNYTIKFINENQAEATGTLYKPDGSKIADITWQQTKQAE